LVRIQGVIFTSSLSTPPGFFSRGREKPRHSIPLVQIHWYGFLQTRAFKGKSPLFNEKFPPILGLLVEEPGNHHFREPLLSLPLLQSGDKVNEKPIKSIKKEGSLWMQGSSYEASELEALPAACSTLRLQHRTQQLVP
jgi:hypothetical protein